MRRFATVASGLFACLSVDLAACGDDGARHPADAPRADDDAAVVDAAPGTVNITADARLSDHVPRRSPTAGVTVFAVSPAGTLIDSATTGSDGKAKLNLPAGGSVTAVYPEDADKHRTVTTYFGVAPGDSLTFGDPDTTNQPASATLGSHAVAFTPVAGASTHSLLTPCGSGSDALGPISYTLDARCHVTPGPLALFALSSASSNVIASVYQPAATFAIDGQLTIGADQWVAQADAPNHTVTLTGLETATTGQTFGAVAEYGLFNRWEYGSGFVQTNTTATGSVSMPTTAPAFSTFARVANDNSTGRHYFFRRGASPTIPVGGLPWFDSFVVDQAARQVTWAPSAGSYDAAVVRLQYSYTAGIDVHSIDWFAILPPGVNQLAASTLPVELTPFLPTVADGFSVFNVRLVDLADAASYDQLRALPEWQATYPWTSLEMGDLAGAAVADGGEGGYGWDFTL